MLHNLRRLVSSLLIVVFLSVSLILTSPANAYAGIPTELLDNLPDAINAAKNVFTNKQLQRDAKRFMDSTPDLICSAYSDLKNGGDSSHWDAIIEGGSAAVTVGQAITSASAAGAGSLTGYAGIAAAVSNLGIGGLTQAAAGFLGSNVAGAAATAVVTSAVGGPIAMAALITAGVGATAYGTSKLTGVVAHQLGDWAEQSCNLKIEYSCQAV